MAHIQYVDGLIREYILFRGFSNTLKAFDSELKSDKDKSFRVDKVIEQILLLIHNHDLQGLRELWAHLNNHLFRNLEHHFATAVNKLEQSVLKFYLIVAYTSNKTDKITEFFTKLSSELVNQSEWKEWFFFPFCKNPEEHAAFAVCFSKQWQDTLLISLHNFLSTIYQCMPQPIIAKAESEGCLIKKLQEENALLRSKLSTIQQQQLQQQYLQTAGPGSHHSRLSASSGGDQRLTADGRIRYSSRPSSSMLSLNDLQPFGIPPPTHIVDDFYIIAQESNSMGNAAEGQARGLKSLIRNIGSGGSPVLGRREAVLERNKKRSGSVGSRGNWIHS
ncbi:WD repeat-containing protein 91 [Anopheles ziemanni]|uniref:WD repeat-containing protein 91 n=1 Tax=Anopheles coustani TaxID=139045 RepID=UPI00265A1E92|nr:WD repeat-containing protein 91 [Anopheles coustani]XP_058173938.1 WD repeat-containing protein 91 [Anopheles ziemanni]